MGKDLETCGLPMVMPRVVSYSRLELAVAGFENSAPAQLPMGSAKL